MGWRYYCFTTGGLALFLWAVRFTMPLLESPRYLVGKGKDEEAVRVVQKLARINGKTCDLSIEQLLIVERDYKKSSEESELPKTKDLGYVKAAFRHTKGLFATPRMAKSTILIFSINCKWYSSSFDKTDTISFYSFGWDRYIVVFHVPTIYVSPYLSFISLLI